MKARPSKTHRVTMSPTEYRAWLDYRALRAPLRAGVRQLTKALRDLAALRRAAERKAASLNP